MILSDMQARIREGMQYLQSSTEANNYILYAIQAQQRDLEKGKSLPQFILEEDATITGAGGVSTAAIPSDFIRLAEEHVPVWTSASGSQSRELKIDSYGYLRGVWFNSTVTNPVAMAIRKSTFKIFPTPSSSWTITYSYYKKQAVPSAPGDENAWMLNVPDLMINGAGMRFAADRQDQDAAKKFSTLYASFYASYLASIVDGETQDQAVLMGGNN